MTTAFIFVFAHLAGWLSVLEAALWGLGAIVLQLALFFGCAAIIAVSTRAEKVNVRAVGARSFPVFGFILLALVFFESITAQTAFWVMLGLWGIGWLFMLGFTAVAVLASRR